MGTEKFFYPKADNQTESVLSQEEIPSREMLEALRPDPQWLEDSQKGIERKLWKYHGDAHIARLIIEGELLIALLRKNETLVIEKNFLRLQKFAVILADLTHDELYEEDDITSRFGIISLQKYFIPHMEAGSNQVWLESILRSLVQGPENLLSTIQENEIKTIVQMTSQINLIHDYRNESVALDRLKQQNPDLTELPIEYHIFRDLDSGLERVRVEGEFHKILHGSALERRLLQSRLLERLAFQRLRNPYFRETLLLTDIARDLYIASTSRREYRLDQWAAVMNAAELDLGIIKP